MKALILNSGMGRRMGELTCEQPKCMTEISDGNTILGRQLKQLVNYGIDEIVITTGYFDKILVEYCNSLNLPVQLTFVNNPLYENTNYIYSIYCAGEYLEDDILLLHGDLVFDDLLLKGVLECEKSCMAVSSVMPLPDKDFKAVVLDGRIRSVGIDFWVNAVAAQPLYKLNKKDWLVWLNEIIRFCEDGQRSCYAENAFNNVSSECNIIPYDCRNILCNEIDNPKDLESVNTRLEAIRNRTVYMCFSTDIIHSGHISLIRKAAGLGKLIVGVLSDEAVVSYKRFPLLPFSERKIMFENLTNVHQVVAQNTLSYTDNIRMLKPDLVVHGDDWINSIQTFIREEVIEELSEYGGKLIEFPYTYNETFTQLERRARADLSTPDARRSRLRKVLAMKDFATALEAHSGLSGLIAENTVVYQNGGARQFDAMWVSSLCDSTQKGKPDIELVDMTSRFRTVDDIMEVTTKPIIFDGDTGGLTEHFAYTVRTLERMGVSMVIIEDKTGLKKNSLFGTEVAQTQAEIKEFCEKIMAGKKAQKTKEFMICARIESLILEKGIEDALKRAEAYVEAGADAIMIHSRQKEPSEIFDFVGRFRKTDRITPIVVVPTSFNQVTEEEFQERGVNVVIYANHLTRSGFPAMQNTAKLILEKHRSKECDDNCMSFEEIIRLIPEE